MTNRLSEIETHSVLHPDSCINIAELAGLAAAIQRGRKEEVLVEDPAQLVIRALASPYLNVKFQV